MNISVSILVLMLLWLIGGSPPVRSRKISPFTSSQYKLKSGDIHGLSNNETSKIHKLTSHVRDEKSIFIKSAAQKYNDTKFVSTHSRYSCDERRSLLKIVIDTPIIYEVTVVSKSVIGK